MWDIDRMLTVLIEDTAPGLFDLYGVGVDTAASLLVTAGDNPDRLHAEGSWAPSVVSPRSQPTQERQPPGSG
jgi:hypothetical protein